MNEIQKADAEARRRALLIVVVGAAVGCLALAAYPHFEEWLRGWILSDPAHTASRANLIICLFAAAIVLLLVGMAVYVWRLGAKVSRQQRFPPPGVRVLYGTPVLSGPAAMTRGRVIQVVAVFLGLSAVVLAWFFWRLTSY